MADTQNLKGYYKFDVFAFGNGFGGTVWGGLTYYMGIPVAFLTFLNASKMQIGMITAIFWAGFALPQIWAAYVTETKKIKKNFMATVLLLSNMTWLIMGLYILLAGVENPAVAIWMFLLLYIFSCVVVGMFIPGQFSLLFKLIPVNRLGALLGILFAVQFLGNALSGPVIQWVNNIFQPPVNYSVLFLLTFVITIIISGILLSIKEPEGEDFEGSTSFGAYLGKCMEIIKTDKLLGKFIIGKWLMSGHYVMLAFTLAFLMQERGFDPAKAGWFPSLHGLGLFIGGFTITKIADSYGPKYMLITSHLIAILYTVIVWLVPGAPLWLILAAFVITGLAQVSDNVGYSNMCMLCCPTMDKSTYVAVTNIGVNMLTVPLPIILGQLMDMNVLTFNSTFAIVLGMMILAVLYVAFVVDNPKAFVEMKAAG